MDGRRITVFDAAKLPGGAMDGIKDREKGYRIRGDRELEDHMECTWDLWRSIPSIEVEDASVLDEFYWLNKEDPTYTLRRATWKRGEPIPMADKMTLSNPDLHANPSGVGSRNGATSTDSCRILRRSRWSTGAGLVKQTIAAIVQKSATPLANRVFMVAELGSHVLACQAVRTSQNDAASFR